MNPRLVGYLRSIAWITLKPFVIWLNIFNPVSRRGDLSACRSLNRSIIDDDDRLLLVGGSISDDDDRHDDGRFNNDDRTIDISAAIGHTNGLEHDCGYI